MITIKTTTKAWYVPRLDATKRYILSLYMSCSQNDHYPKPKGSPQFVYSNVIFLQ